MKAAIAHNETDRLAALRRYGILDTPRERDFDEVVALAARLCDAPIAVINLIDDGRQWFKAEVGLGVRETPLDASICSHAILQPGVFQVPDTLEDPRFRDNPLCTGDPHLRFYTGALLETSDGYPIGTLCVLDHRPRRLDSLQIFALEVLSRQVMAQIELRWALGQSEVLMREIDHRIKNSLALVSALLGAQARNASTPDVRELLEIAQGRVVAVAELHDELHKVASGATVSASDFLPRIARGLQRTAPDGVVLNTEVAPVLLQGEQALPLGLLVNEVVTNALKHAYPDGQGGRVSVRLHETHDRLELTIADDGVGIGEPGSNPDGGLGVTLINRLASQLRGTAEWGDGEVGTRFRLSFSPQLQDMPSVA